MKEKALKDLIIRVNNTLRYFEKEYIELKRTPESEKEVCESFEQYIEIRFNMESCQIPEFSKLEEMTDGHLFRCTSIMDPDEVRRRFSLATIELTTSDMFEGGSSKLLEDELSLVREFIGGSKISFNCVKKRIKIQIDE